MKITIVTMLVLVCLFRTLDACLTRVHPGRSMPEEGLDYDTNDNLVKRVKREADAGWNYDDDYGLDYGTQTS